MGKKFAQYGGVGGQYAPYSPGGSPLFRGGPSGGGGYGVNSFAGDTSLDNLMGYHRKPEALGFEKPLETMLETFHDDIEADIVGYLLDEEERKNLKRRKSIRVKEQFIKDLGKQKEKPKRSLDLKDNKETVEDMLEEFRMNTGVDFNKMAQVANSTDMSIEEQLQIGNKKPNSYYRRPNSLPMNEVYLPTVEEHEDKGNPLSIQGNQFTQPFTGIAPQYEYGKGVDNYIAELNNPTFPDNHAYAPTLDNFPDESQLPHQYTGSHEDLGSKVTEESKKNNQPLERKLEKMKKSPKNLNRLDQDEFYGLDWDEMLKGKWPQRNMTNEGPYTNDTMGGYATNDYPDTSNNPYFGVLN